MQEIRKAITVDTGTTVSSAWAIPEGFVPGATDAVILAHGAGNDMESFFISHVHRGLAKRGLLSVKFNFPYKERGRKAPDRTPVLEAAWRAVLQAVRTEPTLRPGRIVLAGKSMGGRIASHLAAAGEPCAGLIFLGYPLHPANRPEQLRVAHLPQITCPMLFVQGSRDPLCRLDLLQEQIRGLVAPVTLHVVAEGNHSLELPKRLKRVPDEVLDEVIDVMTEWIERQ